MQKLLKYSKILSYLDGVCALGYVMIFFFKLLYVQWNISLEVFSITLCAFCSLIAFIILNCFLLYKQRKLVIEYLITIFGLIITIILGLLSFISSSITFHFSSILLSTMILLKIQRIFCISLIVQQFRKGDSKITRSRSWKRVLASISIAILIIVPTPSGSLVIFGTDVGNVSIDLASSTPGEGLQQVQLSFYATSSSYSLLTNTTILSLLNGSDFSGTILPVEILLLVRESFLVNGSDSAPNFANVIRNCTMSGLPVWLWFVYTRENGYYPSWEDASYLPVFKDKLNQWINHNSLDIQGILFDNELDSEYYSYNFNQPLLKVKNLIQKQPYTAKNWSESVSVYENIIQEWKSEGYDVGLIGSDFGVLDITDNDVELQQSFGLVNFPPISWDRASIMMYRSDPTLEYSFGSNRVYSLSSIQQKFLSINNVAALGCMGFGAYEDLDSVLADIALLKVQGYDTIELFEIAAFFDVFGYSGLETVLNASQSNWIYPKFSISSKFFDCMYILGLIVFDGLLGMI